MARDSVMHVPLDEIVVHEARRSVDMDAVKKLAASIKDIGLQHPLTVRSIAGQFILVAGRHRLEAFRYLNEERVPIIVSKMDDVDAEMWEISENLHRTDLTTLQRSEQIDRWRELKAEKVRQAGAPSGGQQPREQGVRKTADDLGVAEQEVRRATVVASLSDDAKNAAREVGLDNNQAALVEAKRAGNGSPEAEVKYLRDRVAAQEAERARKEADKTNRDTDRVVVLTRLDQAVDLVVKRLDQEDIDNLISWLDGASLKDFTAGLRRRLSGDQPIMDRRYA